MLYQLLIVKLEMLGSLDFIILFARLIPLSGELQKIDGGCNLTGKALVGPLCLFVGSCHY